MPSLKSKDISEYFEVQLAEIRPDVPIPFSIHLYFQQNSHIMLWKETGETISQASIEKYLNKGIKSIWLHRTDLDSYQDYKDPAGDVEFLQGETPGVETTTTSASAPNNNTAAAAASSPAAGPDSSSIDSSSSEEEIEGDVEIVEDVEGVLESEAIPPEPIASPHHEEEMLNALVENEATTDPAAADALYEPEQAPPLPEAVEIAKTLSSNEIPEEEKKSKVSETAKDLLAELAAPTDLGSQAEAMRKAKDLVEDILSQVLEKAASLVQQILKLSNVDSELGHSVNVATYAVVFAMAFGRIDKQLLADLAMAGLLHDIGISQIPASIASIPMKDLTPKQLQLYAFHIKAGVELIEAYAPEVPERVKMILLQHHEKFDGTGFPQRLKGFDIDDVAQLLSMADVMDSIASGHWDGKKRTVQDTLKMLEKLEKTRTFPEYFNPDIFAAVLKWTRSQDAENSMLDSVGIIEEQTKRLIGRAS